MVAEATMKGRGKLVRSAGAKRVNAGEGGRPRGCRPETKERVMAGKQDVPGRKAGGVAECAERRKSPRGDSAGGLMGGGGVDGDG